MAIAVQMDYTVDLCKPAHLIQMDVPFFTGDKNAHRFHVKLVRNGCEIGASGLTATGYMVRADKQTVVWDGEVAGCDIYLTMPAACYAVAGRFRLLLRVTLGDTVETALWVEGSIRESTTDVIVDPGSVLPNLEELLAQIAEMEAVTAEARETLDTISEKFAPSIVPTVTGALVNVTDAVARPAVEVISQIEAVQSGSGDPSPDNVRPISGWDAVSVTRIGKNLVDIPDFVDTDAANIRRATADKFAAVKYKESTQYTVSMKVSSANTTKLFGIAVGYSDGSTSYAWIKKGSTCLPSVTTSAGKTVVSIMMAYDGVHVVSVSDVQLEEGAVATQYEPYQEVALAADLPETVYGGSLDWTTGVLTVTHGYIDAFAGEEVPVGWISSTGALTTGAQVVYPLAATYTIQLTPQQLTMLEGHNAVGSNTGDTTLVYVVDMKLYIDNKFSALQAAILAQGANI